jgi:hypothetical protein
LGQKPAGPLLIALQLLRLVQYLRRFKCNRHDGYLPQGLTLQNVKVGLATTMLQMNADPRQAKSMISLTPTSAKRLKPVQDALKPLVVEHLQFDAPGMTTEAIFQKVMAKSGQAGLWSTPDTLRVHVRSILKNMHDLGEVQRKAAVRDNGGSTFVYTLPRNSQRGSLPPATTTPMRSSINPRTPFMQHVIGSPNGFSHLLWRSDEAAPVDSVGVKAHENPDDDNVVQDLIRPSSPNEASARSERTPTITEKAGFELSQEHESSSVGHEDSDETDRKLLDLARTLRNDLELASYEMSTLESQREHNQRQYLTLERQANEQGLQETELLASAQRLREEALKVEGQAAECRENVDRLHKEASGKRESEKHYETNIAATQKKANGIEEKMQKTRDKLRI